MVMLIIATALPFFAIAIYKRQWGLYLFVFLLPLYILRIDAPTFSTERIVALSVSEILFYALIAAVIIRDGRAIGIKIKELIAKEKLLLLGALYILAGIFVGVWQSNNALQTLGILRGWVLAPIALFFIAKTLNPNKEYVVRAFAASASAVAAVSFFVPHAFNADGRLQGFYGSPNYLAMYLAPLLPLVVYEIFKSIRNKDGFNKSALWITCCAVIAIAILFSFSQGAWLGMGAATIGAILWYVKKKIFNKYRYSYKFFYNFV